MFNTTTIIAAVVAGILGCIANAVALYLIAGIDLMPLILSAGRMFWSVVFALALIPIFAKMSGIGAWVTGFVVLNALASLSAVYVWGAGAPWSMILTVNGVYAITAEVVYVLMARRNIATA